jgi:Fic-DOC domain mobile mystery protein B
MAVRASCGDESRLSAGRRHADVLESEFVCRLHKRMFGNTWRWAGKFRTSEKNIGVDPARIQPDLRNLCEDVKTQLEFKSYPLDEIAARFSHRLVSIHPFANGNGQLSRTAADLLLVQNGMPRFTWGAGNLVADGEVRQRYLAALRAADARDYGPLLAFVRS